MVLGGVQALVRQTPPAWVGVQPLPVIQSNVLKGYKTVFKKDSLPPFADACKGGPAWLRGSGLPTTGKVAASPKHRTGWLDEATEE